MTGKIPDEPANPLLNCQDERQALHDEIENLKDQQVRKVDRLKADIVEIQRKHKIALDNAYTDGYRAGQADRWKPPPR